jgi:hypothetical protein
LTMLPMLALPVERTEAQTASGNCDTATSTCVLAPVANSFVESTSPTLNYGADIVLNVESAANGTSTTPVQIAYLKFDLTAIPSGEGVLGAKLSLYLKSKTTSATGVVGAYTSSNTTWGGLEINWNNKPPYSASPIAVNNTIAFSGQYYTWSVTKSFAEVTPAVTFVLVSQAPSGGLSFESASALNPPSLTITYGPASGTVPPAITQVTVSPLTPSSEDLVTVSASITDTAQLASVVLSYSVNSSAATSEPMLYSSGNTYQSSVERESSGSTVALTITATDIRGLQATATYSYTVQKPGYYYALLSKYTQLQALLQNLTTSLPSIQNWKSFQANYNALEQANTNLLDSYNALTANYQLAQQRISNLSDAISSLSNRAAVLTDQLSQSTVHSSTIEEALVVVSGVLAAYIAYTAFVVPRRRR